MGQLQAVSGQPHWAISDDPAVLSSIYQDAVTISIWQRQLDDQVDAYVQALLASPKKVSIKLNASPDILREELAKTFPADIASAVSHEAFLQDLNQLIEMFCCLFELKKLGLRIHTLEGAMCLRFHVDYVPVRMITTYGGPGTQWLPADYANCVKLGPNAPGVLEKDLDCGVIQQLNAGDVALLKGEKWEGNEGRGLIHRSPSCVEPNIESTINSTIEATAKKKLRRLLITCDLGD